MTKEENQTILKILGPVCALLSDLDRQERSKVRENCKVGSFPTAGSRPACQPASQKLRGKLSAILAMHGILQL